MKIKDFRKEINKEEFNIPDALENVKPIAYNKEFNLEIRSKKYFNYKIIFKLISSFAVITLVFIIIINNYNLFMNKEEYSPEDNNSMEPNPTAEATNEYNDVNKIDSSIEKYYSYFDDSSTKKDPGSSLESNSSSTIILSENAYNYLKEAINSNTITQTTDVNEIINLLKVKFPTETFNDDNVSYAMFYIINKK